MDLLAKVGVNWEGGWREEDKAIYWYHNTDRQTNTHISCQGRGQLGGRLEGGGQGHLLVP